MLAQLWDEGWEKADQHIGWRRCGAHPGHWETLWSHVCVIRDGEAGIKAMLWGKFSQNKEQGKCRLSARKALSISPINCTDPSSTVDTQLTLHPLDPTSVVRDKQIYSYIHGADLPRLHITATQWALRKTVFCKSYALALCLFACLSAFFCLLAACKKFEREGIVYLRKS